MRKAENKKRNNEKEKKPRPIQTTATYKVQHSGQLLDFLLAKMNMSRNSIKHLLSDHKVLINGNPVTQFDYPLAKDDEIKIAKYPVYNVKTVRGKPIVKENPIEKNIIYEDDTYIAINKPAGLLSVESDHTRICAYVYVSEYVKKTNPKARVYILHRIDKETSGVLVFTKDIKVHSKLKMHWNEDVKEREYIAVTQGKFSEKTGTLINYLKEDENNLVYITKNPKGKKAITHYEVLEENESYSLLRVKIDTGRKNQIRVQMKGTGHPIIGDDKYNEADGPIGRLGLHASKLVFTDPNTGKDLILKAPTPKEFQKLFEKKN